MRSYNIYTTEFEFTLNDLLILNSKYLIIQFHPECSFKSCFKIAQIVLAAKTAPHVQNATITTILVIILVLNVLLLPAKYAHLQIQRFASRARN